MPMPFHRTPSTVQRIETTPSTIRRLDPAEVAKALGAEPTGDKLPPAGPLTLFALRTELYRRRISSGGRPGIAGTDQRPKIAVSNETWADLESMAAEFGTEGHSPSAGQVAAVLLDLAVKSVKEAKASTGKRGPLGEELAAKVASKA